MSEPEASGGASESPSSVDATASSSGETPSSVPVFEVEDPAPAPRDTAAPGVLVALPRYSPEDPNGQQIEYVVVSVAEDGTVTENWRFLLPKAADGSTTFWDSLPPYASSFSSDGRRLALSGRYRLESGVGFDSHAGYLEPYGGGDPADAFVDLSGRRPEQTVKGAPQYFPTFGPEDRLFYWQLDSDFDQSYRLMSVDLSGGDRRDEERRTNLLSRNQDFRFTQGDAQIPYAVDYTAAASEDGSTVALADGYIKVGDPDTTLDEFLNMGVPHSAAGDVIGFVGSSADEVICRRSNALCVATIDEGSVAVEDITPDDSNLVGPNVSWLTAQQLPGEPAVDAMVATGSRGEGDYDYVVTMGVDGSISRSARIAVEPNVPLTPRVIGRID